MSSANPKNIVFITGSFVGSNCWDHWQAFFQEKGYATIAPSWPFKVGSASELRGKHPSGNLGLTELGLRSVTDYFARVLESFQERPIIIGHSLGGLIAQILLNKDLAALAVAIHPIPPLGILPREFSFYKAFWKSWGWLTSSRETYLMSFKDWQYAFVHNMALEEQKETYEAYVIAESKRVNRGVLTGSAKIDFRKPHEPLLIVSGDQDRMVPASLNKRNARKYALRADSIVDYRKFPGRNHFVLGQPTWREDARYILGWMEEQLEERAAESDMCTNIPILNIYS
jgi:pimeloyl-ACP methyl ester carboxylesterase